MMKKKKTREGVKTAGQNLLKNPSYRNMVNPYESKYPQSKKTKTGQSPKPSATRKMRPT
jgi:hypothetical protein